MDTSYLTISVALNNIRDRLAALRAYLADYHLFHDARVVLKNLLKMKVNASLRIGARIYRS